MPSTTVPSYQWTCPGSYCDAGAVDPEWAARMQQGNILVVNVRNSSDNGDYTCTVMANTQQLGTDTYTLSVASEYGDCTVGDTQKVGIATYTLSVASEFCTGTMWHI